jgi:hypothetical protein
MIVVPLFLYIVNNTIFDLFQEFGKSLGYVFPEFLDGHVGGDAWRHCYEVIAAGVSEVSTDKLASEDKATAENEI